ncbi:MAG TPA: hypothetical protein VF584_14735 [Longimicrobium sp.]|jgi:hypothetical protein
MLRLSLAGLLAVALTASAAPCQQRIQVAPGTRVRVTVPIVVDGVAINRGGGTAVGTIVGIDSESITTRRESDGAVQTTPFSALTHLEISRGILSTGEARRRGTVRGALIGGGIAVSTYALYRVLQVVAREAGKDADCNGPDEPFCEDTDEMPYVLELIGGGILGGALIGFTVGSLKREHWVRVSPRSLEPVEMPREVSLIVSVKL